MLLNKKLPGEDQAVINLASKEYSQCVEKYITEKDRLITVEFCQITDGRPRQKGTLAKMARGEMVRFMAENRITDPVGIKGFDRLGFVWSKELSGENRYVFVME
jgi:cytoplasmic iron level regulating protein YaaA (DUF328/UPF0246 family)